VLAHVIFLDTPTAVSLLQFRFPTQSADLSNAFIIHSPQTHILPLITDLRIDTFR